MDIYIIYAPPHEHNRESRVNASIYPAQKKCLVEAYYCRTPTSLTQHDHYNRQIYKHIHAPYKNIQLYTVPWLRVNAQLNRKVDACHEKAQGENPNFRGSNFLVAKNFRGNNLWWQRFLDPKKLTCALAGKLKTEVEARARRIGPPSRHTKIKIRCQGARPLTYT